MTTLPDFSEDGPSVADQVAGLLAGPPARTVAIAESCTDGLVARRLTERPGSSAYLAGGLVVDSNQAKTELAGVDPALIQRHGAVSPQVAAALADGAIDRFASDVGIGVTGVAGPDDESADKGLVCFCVTDRAGERVERALHLPGIRAEVRDRSTTVTMHLLRRLLQGQRDPIPGASPAPPPVPTVASAHVHRFRVVVGALIGIAIGAVAATLVLAAGQGPSPETRWSAWHPRSSSVGDGAQQIADHVAPSYRRSDGDQLVGVTGGPLKVPQLDAVRIAVADAGARNIAIVRGKTALYTLCGLGARCSINRGKASVERGLLLRREALELALYSFRYLDGVDSVVALIPPAPGEKPQKAVFFKREGLQPALDRPLPQTLPSPPPTLTSLTESPQATLVNSVTSPSVFCYSFQQGQDLGGFLILQKPTNDPKKPCRD